MIYPMGLNECSRKPHVLFYFMQNKFQWSLGAGLKKGEHACKTSLCEQKRGIDGLRTPDLLYQNADFFNKSMQRIFKQLMSSDPKPQSKCNWFILSAPVLGQNPAVFLQLSLAEKLALQSVGGFAQSAKTFAIRLAKTPNWVELLGMLWWHVCKNNYFCHFKSITS